MTVIRVDTVCSQNRVLYFSESVPPKRTIMLQIMLGCSYYARHYAPPSPLPPQKKNSPSPSHCKTMATEKPRRTLK